MNVAAGLGSPQIAVRVAHPEDAPVVADVYLRAWLAGYDGLVSADRLAPVAAERATHDWSATLADAELLIGTVSSIAGGIAKVGSDPTEPLGGTWLELLYVVPEFWGTGLAGALLERAVERARSDAVTTLRLRVVEDHQRARRFYEREGWSYDPAVPPSHNAFFPLLCMSRTPGA